MIAALAKTKTVDEMTEFLYLCGKLSSVLGTPPKSAARSDKVKMTFVEDDGTEVKVEAELGATLLEVAHDNDIELEGDVTVTRGESSHRLPARFPSQCVKSFGHHATFLTLTTSFACCPRRQIYPPHNKRHRQH